MAFDEQLTRAFETLGDYLRAMSAELAAAAEADRKAAADEANRKVATAEADRKTAADEADRKIASAEADRKAAVDEAARKLAAAEDDRDAAMGEADRKIASAEADRKAVAEEAEQRGRDAADHQAAAERLVDAIRAIDRARSLSEILDTLAGCAGREVPRVGVLLVRGDRLRGWRFVGFPASFDVADQIDLALNDGGIMADAVRTGAAVSSKASDGARAPFAEIPRGGDALAMPIPLSGQVVAVLYANRADSSPGWSARLEVMALHAARCLEALTALMAARAFGGHPEGVRAGKTASAAASGADAARAAGEDDEAARRYARLLVSEIKLYHEAAVIEGRRERDLATRLGGEIARARVLYEQRVPAHLRSASDYFHAELIRTLADGDSSLLGEVNAGTP